MTVSAVLALMLPELDHAQVRMLPSSVVILRETQLQFV
jgi:hypothetical protein